MFAATVNPALVLGGMLGGLTMGLTGMGGGALLTPMLVLVFHVSPAAAVGSDLVTSLVAKPVGGAVHLRHGTVRTEIVKWLCLGSVPGAFVGVLALRAIGDSADEEVRVALGYTLLVAAVVMIARHRIAQSRESTHRVEPSVRPAPTLALGLVGGIVVGMTSVGSGSLMIAVLAVLYPTMTQPGLVGTDLVQAIPLVGSAAIAHLVFGHVEFAVTSSLLLGSLPGIYLGARYSARTDGRLVRALIPIILIASSLKLLEVGWAQAAGRLGGREARGGQRACARHPPAVLRPGPPQVSVAGLRRRPASQAWASDLCLSPPSCRWIPHPRCRRCPTIRCCPNRHRCPSSRPASPPST